jgi:hypothetical protein
VEGADQGHRRFAQAHPTHRRPQVHHVALLGGARLVYLQYGLIVYPQPKEEVEILIAEFCKGLSDEPLAEEEAEAEEGQARGRLSGEVDGALRNLMGLRIEPVIGKDGQPVDTDPAEALKQAFPRPGELQAELFARIRYADRKTTQLWHQDEAPGTGPGWRPPDSSRWERSRCRGCRPGW